MRDQVGPALSLALHIKADPAMRRCAQVLASICSRMVPYFVVNHPTRGRLLGPFSRLPSTQLRRLALDVAATLGDRETGGLEGAVGEAVSGTGDEPYWLSSRTPSVAK